MDKLSKLKPGIVLQGKPLSHLSEFDEKTLVITTYVEKFAAIANRPVTPAVFAAYLEALEDLDIQRIRKGLSEAMKDAESFPWPGTLRRYCEEEI